MNAITLEPHPFEIPDVHRQKPPRGFICFGKVGERCYTGHDSNDAEDAYFDMIEQARRAIQLSVSVDKSIDPTVVKASVRMYRIPAEVEE